MWLNAANAAARHRSKPGEERHHLPVRQAAFSRRLDLLSTARLLIIAPPGVRAARCSLQGTPAVHCHLLAQSGQFRPAGFPSGPLPSRGNPSGPLPPAGGYPPRGPAPGGRSHPNAGPPGWDEPEMPPAPRRSASMPLPSRSGPLPFEDERLPPEYQRGAPPPRSGGRPPTRPTPPPQAPRGWEDAGAAPVPEFRQQSGDFRAGNRRDEVAPKQIERRAEPVWDDDERWSLNRDPDALTLSAMTNAILGGAIGGVLGGALWVGAVVVTGLSMPYLAVVVGLLAGVGARMALEQTRPWIIGAFGALGAALAFLVTQYALFDYGLIHQGLATGLFALSPLRFPQVYIDYVTGVSDDVTHSLGFSGEHPLDMGVLLACMTVCWLVLVRRKR